MFDQLVAAAKVEGRGDLLEGLQIMAETIDQYPRELQHEFQQFMQLGARMFAPIDNSAV